MISKDLSFCRHSIIYSPPAPLPLNAPFFSPPAPQDSRVNDRNTSNHLLLLLFPSLPV